MVKEIPLVWLPGAACTGCSISLLNSASPTIKNILVDQIVPGVHINLRFHPTIMAGAGEQVIKALEDTMTLKKGNYVLAVDGAIPTGPTANYCVMGERNGKAVNIEARFTELAENALAILAVGTCAAFGGIPAAPPNPSNSQPVRKVLEAKGIKKPLINIPGCPPHPDWFVGTVASILLKGLPQPEELDDNLRPLVFYGKLIHENCPRRAYFDEGKFAKKFGDEGCLYELGCKGPITYADCPTRHWNSGTNWVIGAGSPCLGCTQPEFTGYAFYEKLVDVELPVVGAYWQTSKEGKQ
ncbi:MAG TPA: hydrogenase small subunit [Dehalococcoidales bacterium]